MNPHYRQPQQSYKGALATKGSNHNATDTMALGRIPPQVPDVEKAVLGVLLLEREQIDTVLELLPLPECFYTDAHQRVYAAIQSLYTQGHPIDLLTVTEALRKAGTLDAAGGAFFLTQLTMMVVTGANVAAHCYLIKEKWLAREVIRLCSNAVAAAYEPGTDVFDLMSLTESSLCSLHQQVVKRDMIHIARAAHEVIKEVAEKRELRISFTGVPTGIEGLDRCTGGWQPTDLIILAARPSVGKTALSLNLAMNAALDPVKPTGVAYFSLEMSRSQIVKRMQSTLSSVPLRHISQPLRMSDSEYQAYLATERMLQGMNIFIDDTAGITTTELRAKARRLRHKQGIGLVVVDYLQLMQGPRTSGNREQEIAHISRELKALAKELEVPVIALSQLNRAVESRKDNRPNLADLRESGAIEQDADLVSLLYRPSDEELKTHPELTGYAYLDIKKHRNGQTDMLTLFFESGVQRWRGV